MNSLPQEVLKKIRKKYDITISDQDIFEMLVSDCVFGVKSSDIAVMCGHHPSDWNFVHDLRKRAEVRGFRTSVFRPRGTNYFIIIEEENNLPFFMCAKTLRKKIKLYKVEEPLELRERREEKKQALMNERQAQLAEKVKKKVNEFLDFTHSLEGTKNFTYKNVMLWKHCSRTHARNVVDKWVEQDLVTELVHGEGGRNSKNIFKVTDN
jgi:tRNA 2-selenouridine synthase SelU